jgi:hypothetical protein
LANRDSFLQTVVLHYSNPSDRLAEDRQVILTGLKDDGALGVKVGHEGDIVQLRSEDREANRFKLMPKVSFFFNGKLRQTAAGRSLSE